MSILEVVLSELPFLELGGLRVLVLVDMDLSIFSGSLYPNDFTGNLTEDFPFVDNAVGALFD